MALIVGDLGRNNVLIGVEGEPNTLFGDTDANLTGSQTGGDDMLIGAHNTSNELYGDAWVMHDYTHGGDDSLAGGEYGDNRMFGDAFALSNNSRGGDDSLTGGNNSTNYMSGDAAYGMSGRGGNDTLTGGANGQNTIVGDGWFMADQSRGGDDTLIGGNGSTNTIYGDADWYLLGSAQAGDDRLVGGANGTNRLIGDSDLFLSSSRFNDDLSNKGGNDTLIGGASSTNYMYGDAADMRTTAVRYPSHFDLPNEAQGGDDRLISGSGTDHMWGDAELMGEYASGGADAFVFMSGSGDDTIHDFEKGKDLIEFWGLMTTVNTFKGSAKAFAKLPDAAKKHFVEEKALSFENLSIDVLDGDSVIDLGSGNSVTVRNVDVLAESNFRFFSGPESWDFS